MKSIRRPLAMLVALAVVTSTAPLPALADGDDDIEIEGDGGDDAPAPADRPADTGRKKAKEPEIAVAVVVAQTDGNPMPPAISATIQISMERALRRHPRLSVTDQDDSLATRAGRVPDEAVDDALAVLASGESLLRDDRAKLALLELQKATTELAKVLAWTSKQDLAKAQLLYGTSQALTGDKKGAIATFVALQIWRPEATIADDAIAAEKIKPLWEDARKQLLSVPRGAIDIETQPDGAMAYLDGKMIGFTPTLIEGLAAGVHYITLRREGYERRVEPVKVGGKGPTSLAVALAPSEKAEDLATAKVDFATGVNETNVAKESRRALGAIGRLLGVQHVILLVPGTRDGRYTASVFSTDGGARLATQAIRVGDRDLETAFSDAVEDLYDQVAEQEKAEPEVVVKPTRKPPRRPVVQPAKKPIYKKWWFWAGVGGVVLTSITIAAASGADGPPGCPDGSSCGQVLFRFGATGGAADAPGLFTWRF